MSHRCPTPEKSKYRRSQARATLRFLQEHNLTGPGRLIAYRCYARTHWHLGHLHRQGKKA